MAYLQVDIFSLGVVLWEMVTNQVPDRYFFDDNIIEERHCCGAIAALVTECTDMDPERRPSAIEVHQRILSRSARFAYSKRGQLLRLVALVHPDSSSVDAA